MTTKAREIADELKNLPADDLVDIHSELLRAIYNGKNSEAVDAERMTTVKRRIEEIDSENIEPLDAFDELARM